MTTVRLTTCENSFEASLIKNKLEQEGIECFLTNENFTSLFPNYSGILGTGVHIMIEDKDYDRAIKLIDESVSEQKIKCPNCNSDQVIYSFGKNATNKILLVILSLIFWIPFGNIKRTYYCKSCSTEFKK
jgi:hypothetical protein